MCPISNLVVTPKRLDFQKTTTITKTIMANREESPDSTTMKSKKRLLSGSSYTHDSSSSEGSKLRKLSERSDNSASEETTSNATVTTIPPWTSQWSSGVLDRLGIYIRRESCPTAKSMFNSWLKSVMASKRETIENLETRVCGILKHMDKFEALCKLDFDSFININPNSAPSFYRTRFEVPGCTDWTRITPLQTEMHWSHLFTTSADRFAAYVRNMGRIYRKGGAITDSMYGNLFRDFIGLCGVQSFAVPIVETTNLKIGNNDVYSKPDMVILDQPLDADDDDWKTLAVIKQGNGNPKETETISDDIIEQHGGELLLHCPMSLDKDGIFGMIVQNTHVAFTYLSCDKNQLENIKNKRIIEEHCPSIMVSKFYNYLKPSDREELIAPFITLGLLQTLPG